MLDGRKRHIARTVVASSFAITLVGAGVASSPVFASPNPNTVQAKVAQLGQQAEAAAEQMDNATMQVQAAQAALAAMNSDYQRDEQAANAMRQQVAAIVVSQYQGQSLSAASQVLLSNDPQAFIQGMGVMEGVNSQQAATLNQYATQLERVVLRRNAVDAEMATLTAAQQNVAKQEAAIKAATSAAQAQLASLAPAQRAAVIQAVNGPSVNVSSLNLPPVSGMAGVAVRYALAQIGKPYVWGAAGPNAYDCSGLMMAAWGAAGVTLAHFSGSQYAEGTPIPKSDLQPGDLVFYYSIDQHVGMYIGNGMVVNAENPSAGIRVIPLNAMPYAGAVRVG